MKRALLALTFGGFVSGGSYAANTASPSIGVSRSVAEDCTNCLECTGGITWHSDSWPPAPTGEYYPFWANHVDCVNWSCGAYHDECPTGGGAPAAELVARAITGGSSEVQNLVRDFAGQVRIIGGALRVSTCGNKIYANLPLELLRTGAL